MNLSRNIPLMYVLFALEHMLFWGAIWVLYYLHFTNFAGIGLIETVAIATMILGEVPTGAIADLLGKKRTLLVGFALAGLGNIWMGVAGDYTALLFSVFVIAVGMVMRSGTEEALIYDSLLLMKAENRFSKVLANRSTIKMLTLAGANIIGGYLYLTGAGLPYVALGLANLIGVVVVLFLTEPSIDTIKFSWRNYLSQIQVGVRELFRSRRLALRSSFIIAMTAITCINGQVLIDVQLVEQGWNAQTLGVIFALMFGLSAVMAQLAPVLRRLMSLFATNLAAAISIALSMIVVPNLGILLATGVLMMRNGLLEIFGNSANDIMNQSVASKYRATALSTYSMLANAPYALSAAAIGIWMDRGSVDLVTSQLGYMLLTLVLLAGFVWWRVGLANQRGSE